MSTTEIMYGTHAIQATLLIPGEEPRLMWVCGKCRILARTQHDASYCCCTHRLCACGNKTEKHWTHCDSCRAKKSAEKWYAKPEVIWDGEWPLALADRDEYFFDRDSLIDYIEELDCEQDEIIASIRLTSCRKVKPRTFDVTEWIGDDLPEDTEVPDADSISDRINAILCEIGIVSFMAESVRLNVPDILKQIGFYDE